jgi:hypothetical protein
MSTEEILLIITIILLVFIAYRELSRPCKKCIQCSKGEENEFTYLPITGKKDKSGVMKWDYKEEPEETAFNNAINKIHEDPKNKNR